MKILYLFNRVRVGLEDKIVQKRDHDGHFFGLFRLASHGVKAEYLEIEQFVPVWFARFLRTRVLNVHYIHLPLFLKMRKYDFVFTSTALGSLFVKAFLGLKRPRWVIFDYGLKGMMGTGVRLKQRALKFMVGRSDGIITISPGEARDMRDMFPKLADKIEFLHLGVDTRFFTPDFELKEEEFALSPGRDPGRDLRTLAGATHGLVPEIKITAREWDPNKFGAAGRHIKRYDFSPVELREQYKRARLVILPLNMQGGLNDAMGCSTLVESLAMGKAIIATRTETVSAYITHGENGWLVPEGSEGALREAVNLLWNDEALRRRLGRAAREFAEEFCSADIFAHDLANYFKKNINHE
ncbi:MAG: glycosyltransferase family 4 protein [Patescibacteria group bacterium]